MILPDHISIDGFTRDFDALLDTGPDQEESSAVLALVNRSIDPLAADLKLDHTDGHSNCPACLASNAALKITARDLARMTFSEAAKAWMTLRRQDPELEERTHEATLVYIHALEKFFAKVRLVDVTPGHLRNYQIARTSNVYRTGGVETKLWKDTVAGPTVNHELSVLGQMMRFARLWHRIKPYYFPFEQPKWSPRPEILSEEDEELLWKTAAKHPEASLAYWVATITNNTTASGIELRGLRLKNLRLDGTIPEIYIPADSVKNGSRPRKIALNNLAYWAIQQSLKRAIKLGACEHDHYLFPFRTKRNCYDPTRPPHRGFLRKSWEKLRKATGFVDLNPHDLRHHCITRLLENDNNPETVIAIAGHVSRKMLEYYAHQRTRVKYAAVLTLETRKPVQPETTPAEARRHA
jgi:integrase